MKTRAKTAGILFGTLLIGVFLGLVGNRIYMQYRLRNFRDRPFPAMMFTRITESIIQPDSTQVELIQPILDKYNEKFEVEHRKGQQRVEALLDSLQAELVPFLTSEQMERFNNRRKFPPRGIPPHDMQPPNDPGFFDRGFPPDSMRRIPSNERGFKD